MTNKPPITGPDRNQADIQARRLRQRFRKGVFVIPSLLTTANIFCGFYSVMESLAGARFLALVGLSNGSDHLNATAVAAATEHFDRAAITIGGHWQQRNGCTVAADECDQVSFGGLRRAIIAHVIMDQPIGTPSAGLEACVFDAKTGAAGAGGGRDARSGGGEPSSRSSSGRSAPRASDWSVRPGRSPPR